GLCERHTGPQPGNPNVGMNIVRQQLRRLEALWKDDVGLRVEKAERPRHDTNHLARPRVDGHDTSNDSGVAAESAVPEAVGQNHGLGRSVRIVRRRKPSPECWSHAEGRKGFVRDHDRSHLLRVAGAGYGRRTRPPQAELGKRPIVLAIREVHRRAQSHVAGRHGLELRRVPDANQLIRIWIGQRTNQDSIDDAENRSGGADAETERQDGGRREGRTLAEHAHREATLLEKLLHPPDAVHDVRILTNPQRASEVPASRLARLRQRHTAVMELLGALVDMELELTLDVTIHATRAKDVGEAIPEHRVTPREERAWALRTLRV